MWQAAGSEWQGDARTWRAGRGEPDGSSPAGNLWRLCAESSPFISQALSVHRDADWCRGPESKGAPLGDVGEVVTVACSEAPPGDRKKQTSTDKIIPELEFLVLVGGLGVGQVAKGVRFVPDFQHK